MLKPLVMSYLLYFGKSTIITGAIPGSQSHALKSSQTKDFQPSLVDLSGVDSCYLFLFILQSDISS